MKRPALPAKAYEKLVARDGEKCHDCGATGVPLDVEHCVPLWKTRTMTAARRRWYNTLHNMVLRCAGKDTCHARKTKREAAERAHYDRLEKKRKGPKADLRGRDGVRL